MVRIGGLEIAEFRSNPGQDSKISPRSSHPSPYYNSAKTRHPRCLCIKATLNECSPPARGGRLAAALAMFFKTLRICNDEDNLLGGRRRCFKAPGGAPKVRGAVRAVCEIWQY